jgi:RNA-binding protein
MPSSRKNQPEPEDLSGKARRHLRALGHHLRPVVLVGKDGVTPGLIAATETALRDHELVKVKLGENAEGGRQALSTALAEGTRSQLVGVVGRMVLLYRRHPEKPQIVLPTHAKRRADAAS